MVLLANGGVDVPRSGGCRGDSGATHGVAAVVRRGGLRTRYDRHIRRAAVVVGQRSIEWASRSSRRFSLSRSERTTFLLLLALGHRIRLKLRLLSGGGSIPLQHQLRASFEHLRTE